MLPILRDKDGPGRYGLWQTPQSVGGMVWVALPGGVFPSLTCSSCHASLDRSGKLQLGLPNHAIDLGRAKDDYMATRSLYSTWGPGREDIAADGKDNPIVIADVRAVRFERYLHRTANVKNSLIGLALRGSGARARWIFLQLRTQKTDGARARPNGCIAREELANQGRSIALFAYVPF